MISRPPVLPQSRLLFPATQAGSPRGAAPPSALELQSPSSVPPIAGRTPCPQDPWPALPATCPRLYLLHRGRTVTLADRAAGAARPPVSGVAPFSFTTNPLSDMHRFFFFFLPRCDSISPAHVGPRVGH